MTRWDHWKVRGEFNCRCEALERRQDEQFSEARVEFKNIDNRFEEVRGQMHAMQHNLGHQNEASGRALASTDEKLQRIIGGLARPRSRESSSSRHTSSESSAPRRHASRHRDGPVLQSMSSSQAVPSPRHAATSSYDGDLSARPPRREENRPQPRALVIQQEQPHMDHQGHRRRHVPSTTSEASEEDEEDHRQREALEDPPRRHHRHDRPRRQHDGHDEPPPHHEEEQPIAHAARRPPLHRAQDNAPRHQPRQEQEQAPQARREDHQPPPPPQPRQQNEQAPQARRQNQVPPPNAAPQQPQEQRNCHQARHESSDDDDDHQNHGNRRNRNRNGEETFSKLKFTMPSSPVPMNPKNISRGNSRLTRSSACTTIA